MTREEEIDDAEQAVIAAALDVGPHGDRGAVLLRAADRLRALRAPLPSARNLVKAVPNPRSGISHVTSAAVEASGVYWLRWAADYIASQPDDGQCWPRWLEARADELKARE